MNKILKGDCIEVLRTLSDESVDCVMTSPPYWALRDYGLEPSIWGGKKDCDHKWGVSDNFIKLERKENQGDWERPSRKEYNKINSKFKCVVCEKEFEGKHNQKFCSIKCLNTLSNDQRQNLDAKRNFCSLCGAWCGTLGLEPTFDLFISNLCDVFDEVKRVLKPSGTCWVNMGDTYNGSGKGAGSDIKNSKQVWSFNEKIGRICDNCGNVFVGWKFQNFCGSACSGVDNTPRDKKGKLQDKCLLQIPSRFAIEMVDRGWVLRNEIIWHKPNCMPSSVKDRFTVDFEKLFFFVKNKKYHFEKQLEEHKSKYTGGKRNERETVNYKGLRRCPDVFNKNGRSMRAVWKINTKPFPEAHFAVYPEDLCEVPIKSGCPVGGVVLDPFFGSGTTGVVALKQRKQFVGIELNPEYIKIAEKRLKPYLEQRTLNILNNVPPKIKRGGLE